MNQTRIILQNGVYAFNCAVTAPENVTSFKESCLVFVLGVPNLAMNVNYKALWEDTLQPNTNYWKAADHPELVCHCITGSVMLSYKCSLS